VLCSWTTELLYGAVDRILGGLGKVTKVPKDLSEAEYTVADAFVEPCIERLGFSMKEVLPVGWELGNRSTNPSFAQVLPLQDVVLSVHFQAGGDFLLGDMRLVLPYTVLEPGLPALSESRVQAGENTSGAREALGRNLLPVEVDLTVQLGETNLPLRQLLALSIGDVVPLQTRLGDELIAPVEGVPKFAGQVGTLGGRRAYRISSVLNS
jgi:flagellar motor switch protein FliM